MACASPQPCLVARAWPAREGAARTWSHPSGSAASAPPFPRAAGEGPTMRPLLGLRVDRLQLFELEAGTDLLHQLLGVEIDADRVLVGFLAAAHVVLAFDRRLEIVDQELDLIAVG